MIATLSASAIAAVVVPVRTVERNRLSAAIRPGTGDRTRRLPLRARASQCAIGIAITTTEAFHSVAPTLPHETDLKRACRSNAMALKATSTTHHQTSLLGGRCDSIVPRSAPRAAIGWARDARRAANQDAPTAVEIPTAAATSSCRAFKCISCV